MHPNAGPNFPRILGAAIAIAATGALTLTAAAQNRPPRYRVEVVPPLRGFDSAIPMGMNEAGTIVGYAAPEPNHPQSVPVRTQGDELTALDAPRDSFNQAMGINDLDEISGMVGFQPHRWTLGTSTPLAVAPGYFSGVAWAVNNSGVHCGNFVNDLIGIDVHHWWPSAHAHPRILPGLSPDNAGAAFAVNDFGQIAGVSGGAMGVFFAARWDDPNLPPLRIGPLPGAMNSEARAINLIGDVAGRSSFPDFTTHAFLYIDAESELLDLGVLGGTYAEARDVDDLQRVVGMSSTGTFGHAFLWQDGDMHDLNDLVASSNAPFLYLSAAVAINNAGQIAAEAIVDVPDGLRRIARLTPIAVGDLNCDGSIDAFDIEPFTLALFDPAGYAAGYPDCDRLLADVSGDGGVDAFDIEPFIDLLFGP